MVENTLADGNSSIHRLDPKIRIMAAFIISIATALCDNPMIALGYLILSFFLTGLARISLKELAERLTPLLWFLLMIWIFLPLTFEGKMVFQYGWVSVSAQGIRLGAMITLKSVAILLTFSSLVATIPMASLGYGLHQLKVPDKLVFLFLMTYRYIAVIQGEYTRLLRAARFRGFKPGTNLHSYRTYAFLAGMLFVRASFRAKRVYQAMRCRGFQEKFHTLDVYPPNGLNYPFLCTMILVVTLLVAMELTWI